MKLLSGLLVLFLGACTGLGNAPSQSPETSAHEIYLVRHAEKQTGENPSLTPDGARRADTLATLLADIGITHIHSTDYKRTLETAAPTAQQTGLGVQIYDPRDLNAFADQLLAIKGVHLVVGHSNTTPQLVAALGGEPGTEIDEKSEYDRLYVISVGQNGVESRLDRYGLRYQK
ncbi:MAG: SixA phosphatase family protein [Henriciella sp.]